VLALVPAAAVLSRPMSMLRERLALVDELGARLDPRRGLEAMCASLAESLRGGTQSQVVGLVLPSRTGAPAVLSSAEDGSFRTSGEAHESLESLMQGLPDCPVTHVRRHWFDLRDRTRLHAGAKASAEINRHLDKLAELLDVRTLLVVPLLRYGRQHGHLLLGHPDTRARVHDITALAHAAPELLRLLEQAALVDQLQEESAGHERARIGRDLHDSAIQPYLGLKYAVESVALRIPLDNPARAEVDALAELVNGEVAALRELISGLRTGQVKGENALVPAVRRQVRRFSLLFGIDVQLDSPTSVATSRALAGALFHMVNEAMNNVRKHTAARHVWIRLSAEPTSITLVVRDDGATVRGQPAQDFMPTSLSERSAELGGTLSIARHDGMNTELTIRIPI
jgi:signal transduction histidine kinase